MLLLSTSYDVQLLCLGSVSRKLTFSGIIPRKTLRCARHMYTMLLYDQTGRAENTAAIILHKEIEAFLPNTYLINHCALLICVTTCTWSLEFASHLNVKPKISPCNQRTFPCSRLHHSELKQFFFSFVSFFTFSTVYSEKEKVWSAFNQILFKKYLHAKLCRKSLSIYFTPRRAQRQGGRITCRAFLTVQSVSFSWSLV